MKHAYKPQPQAGADSAPGEVITLPPLQVRKTTPPLSRWLRDVTQRLLPPLLGLGLLLLGWQLAAMNSKGFPTPLSTLDSALTLFADRFYQDGPNDMGIGWNVLAWQGGELKLVERRQRAGYRCRVDLRRVSHPAAERRPAPCTIERQKRRRSDAARAHYLQLL